MTSSILTPKIEEIPTLNWLYLLSNLYISRRRFLVKDFDLKTFEKKKKKKKNSLLGKDTEIN